MKKLFLALTLLPISLFSTQVDEEKFHDIINDEVIFSSTNSYNLAISSNSEMVWYIIWFEAGYRKGLITSEVAFEESIIKE